MIKLNGKLLATLILLGALLVLLSEYKAIPTEYKAIPTCAEKGGKKVFSHNITTMMMIGKVMVPQTVPQYKCVYQKEN